MIQYAGVDVSPLTPETAAVLDRWWVREAPALWTWPGFNVDVLGRVGGPAPPPHEPAPLNTLVWPNGASRWAVFHTLVGGTQATSIKSQVNTDSPIARTLVIRDDVNGGEVTPSMFLLKLKPVYVRGARDTQFWWMTLVDARYYWWMRDFATSPDFWTSGTSWASMLTALVTYASGSAPAAVSVDADYGTPTARWQIRNVPYPPLIDAAAAACGLRMIRNTSGSVEFVTPDGARASDVSRMEEFEDQLAVGGRNPVAELCGTIPSSVNVRSYSSPSVSGTTSNVTLASLAISDYGSMAGVANTSGWVFADYSGAVPSALATQAATDYYKWALSRTDATFRTVVAWEPTGLEDRIEWEHMPARPALYAADPPKNRLDFLLPWERLATRVVPRPPADRNVYGSGPPLPISSFTTTSASGGGTFPSNFTTVGSYQITIPVSVGAVTSGSYMIRVGGWIRLSAATTGPRGGGVYNSGPASITGTASWISPTGTAYGTPVGVFEGTILQISGNYHLFGNVSDESLLTGPSWQQGAALPVVWMDATRPPPPGSSLTLIVLFTFIAPDGVYPATWNGDYTYEAFVTVESVGYETIMNGGSL